MDFKHQWTVEIVFVFLVLLVWAAIASVLNMGKSLMVPASVILDGGEHCVIYQGVQVSTKIVQDMEAAMGRFKNVHALTVGLAKVNL